MRFLPFLILFTAFSAHAEDRISRLFFFPEAKQFYGTSGVEYTNTKLDANSAFGAEQQNNKFYELRQLASVGVTDKFALTLNIDYRFEGDVTFVNGGNLFKLDIDNSFTKVDLSGTYLFFKSAEGAINRLGLEFTYGPKFNGQGINDHFILALRATGDFSESTSWLSEVNVEHDTSRENFEEQTNEALLFQVQHYLNEGLFLRGLLQVDFLGDFKPKGGGATQSFDPAYTIGADIGRELAENLMLLFTYRRAMSKSDLGAPANGSADLTANLFNLSLSYKF